MRKLLLLVPMLAATAAIPDLAQLQKMIARFQPTELRVDVSKLSPGDRQALGKLIEAARVLNDIFLTQMWSGNHALYAKLRQDTTPLGKARLDYFWLNKSPWSEIDDHSAFLPNVPPKKLPGANFYPEDMTREEFEAWVKTLSKPEKEQAEGFFTVIHRDSKPEAARRPLQPGVSRRSRQIGQVAGAGRRADGQRDAEEVFDHARGGLSLQRLLRERHRMDGSGCSARYYYRPL